MSDKCDYCGTNGASGVSFSVKTNRLDNKFTFQGMCAICGEHLWQDMIRCMDKFKPLPSPPSQIGEP